VILLCVRQRPLARWTHVLARGDAGPSILRILYSPGIQLHHAEQYIGALSTVLRRGACPVTLVEVWPAILTGWDRTPVFPGHPHETTDQLPGHLLMAEGARRTDKPVVVRRLKLSVSSDWTDCMRGMKDTAGVACCMPATATRQCCSLVRGIHLPGYQVS
jgi:hypothetical protein